jgi:uncharacterized protein YndB with AHSA1/START domain
MTTLHYHITIRAPKARVHQLMLADASYRVWTSEFAPGSYYKGSWDKGAEILFTNQEGFGMKARIAEHRPAEFVSIEMLSELRNGVPDVQDPWQGALENYTFVENGGATMLDVDISGIPDGMAEYMNAAWPKALAKLKTICETNSKLDLSFERIIDVPKELVWKAWTTPEHLMPWFCPLPWKTIDCEIDLRPGGIFRTVMLSPEGKEYPGTGCYLEVIENEKLVWTNALHPGFRPAPAAAQGSVDFFFTASIQLASHGTGTRYTVTVIHGNEADRDTHEKMGFHDGWGKALDQLVAYSKTM